MPPAKKKPEEAKPTKPVKAAKAEEAVPAGLQTGEAGP